MKIDRNSIVVRVLAPIFFLIAAVSLILLSAMQRIASYVSEDYHRFAIVQYSRGVERILDTTFAELTAANVLDKPLVVEAKKRAVIEAIALEWKSKDLDGVVVGPDKRLLYSSLGATETKEILARDSAGHFHYTLNKQHLHGYVLRFPFWGWDVITLTKGITPYLYRKEIAFAFPFLGLGFVATGIGVFVILQRSFRRPVAATIESIQSGTELKKTGLTELDIIGDAVNDSFKRLLKKTEQYQLLHNLAVSIHENLSTEELLKLILDKAGSIMKAGLRAIALYDDEGRFRKLLTLGVPKQLEGRLPEGKGLLRLMQKVRRPLRVDDVAAHPEFSGNFPQGHPYVKNLLGYPILSDDGGLIGALYFGNKPGGFTDEDESILMAISADAAIALNKAERLTELKRFRDVVDSAFDVIVITDSAGRVIYANPAFQHVTGYQRDEIIGKGINILKSGHHDDEFYSHLWDTVTSGSIWKGEFINRKKDGGLYHSSAVIFPIHTEEGVSYVSIQRDITQEKKLYEQLLRAQKMEAIGTLAGGIAHDFNNLLAAILGYSEILLSSSRPGDPTYKPATVIKTAAERGADLAKKILTITRKEKLETRPVNLNEIVKTAEELLRRSMPKDIEIVLNLNEDLPHIKADPTQLQQVVMNLAVNARDAMPEGGRLVIETAVVGSENGAANGLPVAKGGFVKLSVSDTGVGMDVDTQRKIFDPFFTTKESGKGTGLGLYIVHAVVNNHSGYINLYSEPGKGTRFNIYLPFTRGVEQEEVREPEDYCGTAIILVIDDEEHIRELCRDLLEPFGYKVMLAESGAAGVNIFRTSYDRIDLVLLDMVMPKMGGSEVFQLLKTIKPDVKVILCSGYSHNGFAGIDTLMRSGAAGFIQKPFTRQTIMSTIKKALS